MRRQLFFISIFFLLLMPNSSLFGQNETLADQANSEFEHANYTKAASLYGELILANPMDASNYMRRGDCYFNTGSYEKSLSDYEHALKLNITTIEKYNIIKVEGHCHFYLNNLADALKNYNKYLEYFSDDFHANCYKAECLFLTENYAEAKKYFTYSLSLKGVEKSDKAFIYCRIGFMNISLDSLASAQNYYEQAYALDSTHFNLPYLKGAMSNAQGTYEYSIKIYNEILSKDSTSYQAYFSRGIAYAFSKQYDLALNDFDKYKKQKAWDNTIYSEIARVYMKKNNYNSAIQNYLICLKTNSKLPYYNTMISWCYFLAKKYPEALLYANKAIELDSTLYYTFDIRGCINYKSGNYRKSIQDFDKAIQLDSSSANSYYFRGLAFIKTNDKVSACSDWQYLMKMKGYTLLEGEKPIEQLLKENCN